ncbi:MAG: nucleotidyltransferase domain-containing protein [Bdellovibrio sp.]
MKFGMSDEQYALLEKMVIAPLKSQNCTVYIFGSRATGKNHPHSDVDVLFKLPDDQVLPIGFLAKIKEDIEESRFPFIVDIVNEAELAKSYQTSVFSSRIAI